MSDYTRTNAVRMFADELSAATNTITFSDDEKAPKFQLLPSGGRANRVFVVGTVTEIEDVGNGSTYLKARIVDPNGDAFFVFAGQYQPEAQSSLSDIEVPEYVAVVGKTDTYEGNNGDTYVSIQGGRVEVVDEATRDRWVVETAEQTLDRIEAGLNAENAPGVGDDVDADLFEMAREEYGREAVEAVRQSATEAIATLAANSGSESPTSASPSEADSPSAGQDAGDLTDLSGVGEVKAAALQEAGFESLADIANADLEALQAAEGIGKVFASNIQADAEGQIQAQTDTGEVNATAD